MSPAWRAATWQVAAVAVDVLTEQGDLGDTVGRDGAHLGEDVVVRARDLVAAHGRHDAERTVVVTPDLDGDPPGVPDLTPGGQRGREHDVVVDHRRLEDLHERIGAITGLGEQLCGPVHVVRAHDHVDVTGTRRYFVTVLLGQAARHDDLATVLLALPGLQVAEIAVQLVVGVLPDAAGVEHDDVGIVLGVRTHHAVGLEQAGDALGVVLVHLAAVGADDVAAHGLGHDDLGYRGPCGPRWLTSRPVLAIFLNENQNLVRILYLIHIVTIVTAFGPTFFYHRLRKSGETQTMALLHMRIVFPSMVILWVAGMGMAGVNKFNLAETYWITLSILLWVIGLAVSWFLIRPAITDTSDEAGKKFSAGVGVTHLVFTLSLLLMIFKPFVDGTYVLNS